MARKAVITQQDEQEIVASYRDGASLIGLAKVYGCTTYLIKSILRDHKVELRIRKKEPNLVVYENTIVVNGQSYDKDEYIERETAKVRRRWTESDYRQRAGTKSGVPGQVSVEPTVVESPSTIRGRQGNSR